ncbi:hypothetical protein EWM64_g2265 [Hericium alpestre]|uniref:Uncharacterized protein n=1 Tax=Hericium alpestre TaxID=135208 RepID=A0A4Z0A5X3_9AGAM|nr:hypothetical protein EWM64_g2265 [Hericium alpestre]
MHDRFSLDVIDRILIHITELKTLNSALVVSKHTHRAFSTRPRSILTAVLRNENPECWPAVVRFIHYKTTGELLEDEAHAEKVLIDGKGIGCYWALDPFVNDWVEMFQTRYTIKHDLSATQFNAVSRALYRLWLYQACFGKTWSQWVRGKKDEVAQQPVIVEINPQKKYGPLYAERTYFLAEFLRKEQYGELAIIFRFVQREAVQWLSRGGLWGAYSEEVWEVALELLARELDEIVEILQGYRTFYDSVAVSLDVVQEQFLVSALPLDCGDLHPEIIILGDDHLCFTQCDLCRNTGKYIWHAFNRMYIGAWWGTPIEFSERFMNYSSSLVDAIDEHSEGLSIIDTLVDDVLRREDSNLWDKLICETCMSGLLDKHLTDCWRARRASYGCPEDSSSDDGRDL